MSHFMPFNENILLGHTFFFRVTLLGVNTKRPADANTYDTQAHAHTESQHPLHGGVHGRPTGL